LSLRLVIFLSLIFFCGQSLAAEIHVAVASNFTQAMTSLARNFEESSGHKVKLVIGSTGKHYAQIRNGAPFDVFFAADIRRPKQLEEEGVAITGTRFTYAVGKLILWSPKAGYIDAEGNVLKQGNFNYLAIANPALAPYGRAAWEVLHSRDLWDEMKARAVRGENIGQAFQFVNSGNAELGFVALSQVTKLNQAIAGSYWEIPQELYTPIEQQAVLLKESTAGRSFLSYVQSETAAKIIKQHGYEIH